MARCLIAVLSGSPAHAVERVEYYGSLPCHFTPPKAELAFMTKFDLAPRHTLLEMLTNHITFYADGSFFRRGVEAVKEADIYDTEDLEEALRRQGAYREDDVVADITNYTFVDLYEPVPGAAVTLSTCLFGAGELVRDIRIYYVGLFFNNKKVRKKLPFPIKQCDLEHRSRISDRTLKMLGGLLKDN